MRLTRREFIKASFATAVMLAAGCATQATTPVTSAMAVRKAKSARPGQGRMGGERPARAARSGARSRSSSQDGRAVRVRGNPLSQDQPRLLSVRAVT